jgi:hypothetical protein
VRGEAAPIENRTSLLGLVVIFIYMMSKFKLTFTSTEQRWETFPFWSQLESGNRPGPGRIEQAGGEMKRKEGLKSSVWGRFWGQSKSVGLTFPTSSLPYAVRYRTGSDRFPGSNWDRNR